MFHRWSHEELARGIFGWFYLWSPSEHLTNLVPSVSLICLLKRRKPWERGWQMTCKIWGAWLCKARRTAGHIRDVKQGWRRRRLSRTLSKNIILFTVTVIILRLLQVVRLGKCEYKFQEQNWWERCGYLERKLTEVLSSSTWPKFERLTSNRFISQSYDIRVIVKLPKSWIQDFGRPKSWIQKYRNTKSILKMHKS